MAVPLRVFVAYAILSLACLSVHGFTISVGAGKTECFYEILKKGEAFTATYQVGEGGHLDIAFTLYGPNDEVIAISDRAATGTHDHTAIQAGRHTYCFSNRMSTMTEKLVSFDVYGSFRLPPAVSVNANPLEEEIFKLADNLKSIKQEQKYFIRRERVHRSTAESTNDRVKWWSIFQFIALFGICGWQVYYLKSFFETKRVI